MSIIFKTLEWQNFLSTGNVSNKITLNTSASTLIVGSNGEGKSTMLDALTFALFGKAFRSVNKPQLINSINQKNCLVTIEFEIGTTQYKVIRGIKPTVFEIYCSGEMINQDAASKDYQKVLEQQILRLNYKTFTQVVILGSASFVPFMQLPVWQRREVIEDILDIGVFSTMNGILKERISESKSELTSIDSLIEVAKSSVSAQKKLISTMVSFKQEQVDTIRLQIAENEVENAKAYEELLELNNKVSELLQATIGADTVKVDSVKANRLKSKLSAKDDQLNKTLTFFKDYVHCPSCMQSINDEHKATVVSTVELDKQENAVNIAMLETALISLQERQDVIDVANKEMLTLVNRCAVINSQAKLLTTQNKKLLKQIDDAKLDNGDINLEKIKLKEAADEALKLIDKRNEVSTVRVIQDVSAILLKDTGIKTAIIKEYLPVMNKLINGYLTSMDFYVHFELDESFNEVIKSRFRDEFTYASFSEGEKMKIDLAILFTWRQIAKMKNSVNTNLLILDEIFDSSLDNNGTDCFLNIMNSVSENSNIFVISHKGDQLVDKFGQTIRFEKKNDFSTIV